MICTHHQSKSNFTMDDIVSILFRGFVFYKFDLPKLNQCINELDTMVNEYMIPIYIGYGLLIPMTYMIMNMMSSYVKTFDIEDTNDHYMLCDRVGDLEQEVTNLKEQLKSMKHIPSYKELVKGLEEDK